MRRVREQVELRCERSKLREYVERVLVPAFERAGKSKSHIERHTAAVEYVERFVKAPLDPSDIGEQLILNFDAWLWRQQISDRRRRDLVESLRRTAAAYTPERTHFRTHRCSRRVLPDPPAGSLRHYYESAYAPIHLVGRTARYVDENRAPLWRLYEHYGRDVLLAECDDALIADHVHWLIALGLRAATINTGHLAVIQAILRHAHKQGLVDRPPSLRKLPVEENAPDAWSPDQVAAFIEACRAASDRPIGGVDAGDWWESLTRVIWYSGIRRRAVLAIRRTPPDVDLQTGWLRVPGSSMKSRRGQKFRLGLDAIQSVAKIWLPQREFLFEFPYDKTTFYNMFHRIREAAGLPESSSHMGCLHLLRRSCATECARRHGLGAAQSMMGHSAAAVTRKYIDPSKIAHDFRDLVGSLPERGQKTHTGDVPVASG